MSLLISNIILYDKASSVMGYVEVKVENNTTNIRVQHNLNGPGLIFSLSHKEQTHAFALEPGLVCDFYVGHSFDLTTEIFAFVTRKTEQGLVPLASGAVNIQERLVDTDATLHFKTGLKTESMQKPVNEIKKNAKEEKEESVKKEHVDYKDNDLQDLPVTPQDLPPEPEIEWTEPECQELKSIEVLKRAKEVDEVLRAVCSFEAEGLNACKKCPYREHFFKKTKSQG